MKVVVDVLAELIGGLLRLAVAYTLGSVAFLLFRAARRSLSDLADPTTVADAHGRSWTVRVALAPTPLRYVQRDQPAHASQPVERLVEASGAVAWSVLAAVLLAFTILMLEVLLVAVVAVLVFASWLLRGSWQCELVAPDGRTWHLPVGTLPAAGTEREQIRAQIEGGADAPGRGAAPSSGR